jgi:hypothetical protein
MSPEFIIKLGMLLGRLDVVLDQWAENPLSESEEDGLKCLVNDVKKKFFEAQNSVPRSKL